MENYNDIDLKEYKKQFFAAMKTPDVVLSICVAIVGIIIALASSFLTDRKMIVAVIGFVITTAATDMIRRNINKHMNDYSKNK